MGAGASVDGDDAARVQIVDTPERAAPHAVFSSAGKTAGGGLAARRYMKDLTTPLQASTRKEVVQSVSFLQQTRAARKSFKTFRSKEVVQHHNESYKESEQRGAEIKWTDNFSLRYTLGAKVMPTTNYCMEVRHAMRVADSKRVVIKLRYKPGSFRDAKEQHEWRRVMKFMLNLPKSGSIAQLHEVLEDERAYYVVMEKVDGMDLCETLHCEGRLPALECKDIVRQLLAAVAEMHDRGIIHKDLKLENVMIDRTPKLEKSSGSMTSLHTPAVPAVPAVAAAGGAQGGEEHSPEAVVKIIDFDTVEEYSPHGSRSRSVVGTDQYIAQEAYAGKYSPASDIFAVGVIAYRLITGHFPFNNAMFDDEAGENWVGSPKMKEIQERLRRFEVDFTVEPFPTEPHAAELCRGMLAVSESARPKAREALTSHWLQPGSASATRPSSSHDGPVGR